MKWTPFDLTIIFIFMNNHEQFSYFKRLTKSFRDTMLLLLLFSMIECLCVLSISIIKCFFFVRRWAEAIFGEHLKVISLFEKVTLHPWMREKTIIYNDKNHFKTDNKIKNSLQRYYVLSLTHPFSSHFSVAFTGLVHFVGKHLIFLIRFFLFFSFL